MKPRKPKTDPLTKPHRFSFSKNLPIEQAIIIQAFLTLRLSWCLSKEKLLNRLISKNLYDFG